MPHSAEGDEERLVLRAVAALVAFVFAAGVAVALTRTEADDSAVDVPTVDAGPLLIGTGPLPGTSVPEYLARRRAALGRLQGRAVAVVSFDAYRTERDARALVEPTEVLGLLVAAPGGAPSVTTQPPATWSTQERTAAEAERAELGRLRQTSEDPEFAAGFDADITRLGALLERLDSTASVVFGAVVVADAGQLRVLAGRSGVRLVDPVSKDVPDDLVVLAGLRPEETERAGTPRTRPLP